MHLKDGAEFAQGLPTGWVDMETLTSRANRDLWPAWNWLSWHVFKRQQTTPTGRRIKTIDARALPPLRSCLRSACRFPMTGGSRLMTRASAVAWPACSQAQVRTPRSFLHLPGCRLGCEFEASMLRLVSCARYRAASACSDLRTRYCYPYKHYVVVPVELKAQAT